MVDPAHDPGVQLFGVVILIMVVGAGVASLPPARDFRLFVAAATLSGLWVVNLFFEKEFAVHPSRTYFLDAICALIFFGLSRPPTHAKSKTRRFDWAAYLCGLFVLVLLFEIWGQLWVSTDRSKYAYAALLLAALGLVGWGFYRGYGPRAATAFGLGAVLFLALASFAPSYPVTMNFMMLLAYGIVIATARTGAWRNLRAWRRRPVEGARNGGEDSNRRDRAVGAR